MLYLHDVWVNWFEGEENGYNVCYYYEWRIDDKIELIDRMPVFYITTELFNHIENTLDDLPDALLKRMYQQSFKRKGHEKVMIDYACIVTDGRDVLALDTLNYSIPIKKSRLIPRQDKIVLEMVSHRSPSTFEFSGTNYEKKYHLLSLKPELVVGLTRKEKQLKQLLMMALDHLRITNNLEELRYWLIEWKPDLYSRLEEIDKKKAWTLLYEDIKHGWSKKHETFTEKLIRGNPFLERMWSHEQTRQKNEPKIS